MRRELDTAGQSRALLSSDYAKSLSELDSLKQENSELMSLLSAREADLTALKQNYEGLNRERSSVQGQLTRLESDYNSVVLAKEKLSTGLEQQLKVVSQVKMNAEDTSKRLEAEIRRRDEEHMQALSRLRESLEGKVELLARDLRQEKEISMDLRAHMDNLENAKRDAEDRLQSESERATRLQRDFEQLRHTADIREEEAGQMTVDLEDLRRREKALSLTRDELQRELERLRSQANSSKDNITSLQEAVDLKDQESAQLQQENSEIKSAIDELKYEFEKLYQQHSDSIVEMTKLQEMNEELHEQLHRSQAECEILSKEIESLEAKNREIFHNFESELANKARNFRERSLSALGTPSPLKPAPAASPSQDSRYLQASTARSSLHPAASPEKTPDRSAGGTDLTRKLARAAERLVETGPSPLSNLRVSSPMRKQEFASSPQKSGASPMRELHSFGAQEDEDLPQFAGSLRSSAGRPQDIRSRLSVIRSSKQALVNQMEDLQRELQAEPLVSLSSEERFEDK
jgi:chromosome segregation ATPase